MTDVDLNHLGRVFAEAMATALPRTNGDAPHTDDEPPHSWTPIDLVTAADTPPYPGLRHVYSGEPEALKSWAALVLCAEQIALGHNVMYVDYEMGQRMTLERLLALRLTKDQIRGQFTYLEPHEAFTDTQIQTDTLTLLEQRQTTLIVVDAFAGALQSHGLNQNESADVEAFYRRVINPLRSHGAAIVLLDHLAKNTETRGKFAIGSERKVGAADVHLSFATITPFGRGRIGRASITVHKDRPGYLTRPKIGELELVSDPATHTATWRLEYADPADENREFRPTRLMEKISRWLELQYEPLSQETVVNAVPGNAQGKRTALALLVREQYVSRQDGPRGAHLHTHTKPYREAEDPQNHPTSSTSSDLVPTSSRRGGMTTSSTSSPPLQGDECRPDEVDELKTPHLVPVQEPDWHTPRPNDDTPDELWQARTHDQPDVDLDA
jgi:hypothetical protein